MHHFEEERVETRYMFSITSYRKGVLLTCIVFCDILCIDSLPACTALEESFHCDIKLGYS